MCHGQSTAGAASPALSPPLELGLEVGSPMGCSVGERVGESTSMGLPSSSPHAPSLNTLAPANLASHLLRCVIPSQPHTGAYSSVHAKALGAHVPSPSHSPPGSSQNPLSPQTVAEPESTVQRTRGALVALVAEVA